MIFKREIFKNLFTPRQLEKIIIILKSSILLIKLMVKRKSIRMDLVTLQDLLFLPKRLMWKNITRLFLKFGSGSEMSHIIMLQLLFFYCPYACSRQTGTLYHQLTSVLQLKKNSHALLKNENAKNFVHRRGLSVK